MLNSLRSKLVTLDYHHEICNFAFGLPKFDPTIRTNKYYGGDKLVAPNTYFSNFW